MKVEREAVTVVSREMDQFQSGIVAVTAGLISIVDFRASSHFFFFSSGVILLEVV